MQDRIANALETLQSCTKPSSFHAIEAGHNQVPGWIYWVQYVDGGPQLGGECSGLQNISEFSSLWPELSTTFVIDGAMKTSGNYWLI